MNKQSCVCCISVVYLTNFKGAVSLPPNAYYDLIIGYPLSERVLIPIKTGVTGMDFATLLNRIGEAYEEIYKSPEKYGIWGHDIGSLVLERVNVDHDKKQITLNIGS